jgi:hypothetical protein
MVCSCFLRYFWNSSLVQQSCKSSALAFKSRRAMGGNQCRASLKSHLQINATQQCTLGVILGERNYSLVPVHQAVPVGVVVVVVVVVGVVVVVVRGARSREGEKARMCMCVCTVLPSLGSLPPRAPAPWRRSTGGPGALWTTLCLRTS